jgi:hypothetical protein
MPAHDKPSAKQQAYLRSLAHKTGTSFTSPNTKSEASREIDRLKALSGSPRHEHHTDRHAVQRAPRGGATRVHDEEIEGHGPTATWAPGKTGPGS